MPRTEELIGALEPGQLAEAKQRRLPRKKLGRGALALLVALRVYVILAIPLVGYAFVHAVQTGSP